MAGIITVPVVQISGGFYAPDNSVTDPIIKHLATGTTYTGTLIGATGRYKFTNSGAGCPDGYYVFMDGATVKDNVLGSVAEGGTWYGDGALDYLPLSGSDWDAGNKKIINVNDPTTNKGVLNRQTGDARYLLASILSTLMDLASNQTVTGTKTFNIAKINQLGQDLALGGWKITGGAMTDADAGSTLTTKLFTDSKYETLTGGAGKYPSKILGATEQIYSTLVFRSLPFLLGTPTAPFHIPHIKFVKDYVQSVLSGITAGDITAYQQTGSRIRILFSGTEENGRLYTTIESGKNYAESYADADRDIYLYIEGNAVDGAVANANYNKLPAGAYAEFTHYVGAINNIILRMTDGASYIGNNSANKNIFENIIFDNENESATSSLENFKLMNCKFDNTFGEGSYDLNNCELHGINRVASGVTLTFHNCNGLFFDEATGTLFYVAEDNTAYELITGAGDIQGRRQLGRYGDNVASANTITLGSGNAFIITGSTQLRLIDRTGWTAGSVIRLQFSDGTPPLVKHAYSNSGEFTGIEWRSGVDTTPTQWLGYSFMLNADRSTWVQL